MGKFPEGDNPLGNWKEFYGFNVDPFTGSSEKITGGSQSGQSVDVIRADQGDFGFGGGDLRRARKAGHSAHSIMKYLKGDNLTGRGAFYDAGGTTIGQEAINDFRGQLSIEQGMKNMFHSYKAGQTKYDDLFKKYGDLSKNYGDLDEKYGDLDKKYGDLSKKQTTQSQQISQNKELAQQVRINNPSTVQGGSTLSIQQNTQGSTAGMLSAGLAGLSRGSDKEFKNKTINV